MTLICNSLFFMFKNEYYISKILRYLQDAKLACCCSVVKSCLILCDQELQDFRLPCPSLSAGVYSNSCPLSQWWKLACISLKGKKKCYQPSYDVLFIIKWKQTLKMLKSKGKMYTYWIKGYNARACLMT